MQIPVQCVREAALAEEIDLNGRWKSEGETTDGQHSEEEFYLNHDLATGAVHGQSIDAAAGDALTGEAPVHAFHIVDGRLVGGQLSFVQKFAEGDDETRWEATIDAAHGSALRLRNDCAPSQGTFESTACGMLISPALPTSVPTMGA